MDKSLTRLQAPLEIVIMSLQQPVRSVLSLCAILVLGLSALAAGPARADLPVPPAEPRLVSLGSILPDLTRGGYVIYMRHGATEAQSGNNEGGDIGRCETQRNLSPAGRAESTEVGRAIQALRVPIGRVLSSPFCRCKDTAQLVFGHFEVVADLHFALDATASERQRLAAVLRDMLGAPPSTGTNTVVVAHTANLREAAGIWPKPEGVAYVFRPTGNGQFEAVARIAPQDWVALAAERRR